MMLGANREGPCSRILPLYIIAAQSMTYLVAPIIVVTVMQDCSRDYCVQKHLLILVAEKQMIIMMIITVLLVTTSKIIITSYDM